MLALGLLIRSSLQARECTSICVWCVLEFNGALSSLYFIGKARKLQNLDESYIRELTGEDEATDAVNGGGKKGRKGQRQTKRNKPLRKGKKAANVDDGDDDVDNNDDDDDNLMTFAKGGKRGKKKSN